MDSYPCLCCSVDLSRDSSPLGVDQLQCVYSWATVSAGHRWCGLAIGTATVTLRCTSSSTALSKGHSSSRGVPAVLWTYPWPQMLLLQQGLIHSHRHFRLSCSCRDLPTGQVPSIQADAGAAACLASSDTQAMGQPRHTARAAIKNAPRHSWVGW